MKGLRFIIPLAVFLVLAGFLAAGLKLDPREVPSPLIGKPAPAFTLARLDDAATSIRRDDMLGKVWMLNVWASWCVTCREEHPQLLELSRAKVLPILGLNYKDKRQDGLDWLARFGDPYTASVFDANGRVGIDFGVYAVPETFVMDKQGVIRFKHIGAVTPEIVRGKIIPLVKGLNNG